MITPAQSTAAMARLEHLHSMITVDEAAEILTGKRPSLSGRIRKRALSLWRDISLAFSAPFRKTIEAIDGRIMYQVDELELYLQRSREFGFIEQLGMEVPYYDFEDGEIRLISTDLVPTLRGDPPLEFPECIEELRKGIENTHSNPFFVIALGRPELSREMFRR
jgi:hypothetical protein